MRVHIRRWALLEDGSILNTGFNAGEAETQEETIAESEFTPLRMSVTDLLAVLLPDQASVWWQLDHGHLLAVTPLKRSLAFSLCHST